MNTEFFICTHAKDFPWLKYCFRSIAKYARGFSGVTVLVPDSDLEAFTRLDEESLRVTRSGLQVHCFTEAEWPGQGMLWHECQEMFADQWCPSADFIAHLDPDCVFTAPVTPETFIKNGKPILRFENFSFIGARHPGVLRWQECTEKCLPFPVHYETMRCHPEVYHHGLYAEARHQMEFTTKKTVVDYVKSCRNEFPQTFCEYVTLGNVAMHLFPDLYELVEQTGDVVTPPNHLQQFWSHGLIDQPQDIWVNGRKKTVVPIAMIKELGLV